jgi:type II secretory pathway pseudopilin PulG
VNRRFEGFSLVEVTLALGVASLCLITILALLPIGLKTNQNASSQIIGANILVAVIADMQATPKVATTSSQFGVTFGSPKILYFENESKFGPNPTENSRYRITIDFPSNPAGSNAAVFADLRASWPATAAQSNANSTVEMFAAFDRH